MLFMEFSWIWCFNSYFTDKGLHTGSVFVAGGDAVDCLLLHVFPRGVEEDRNGQQLPEEEDEEEEAVG